jgi:group I intron endonuclease
MGRVYIIICKVTPKEYVGQTTQELHERWYDHTQAAKSYIANINDNPDKIKHIRFSYLYRAMAKYGIENFTIEELESADNDLLDDLEIQYIEAFNTLVPNGYNLTTGGSRFNHNEVTIERMKEQKRANIDNVRNEKLAGLPPLVTYRNHPTKGEQVLINQHPLCKHKTFSAYKYGSFENAKIALLEFIVELELNGVPHVPKKRGEDDIKKYKGLIATPEGYRVNKVHKGITYDKRFERKDRTKDENKAAAIQWYIDLLTRLNLPIPQ